MGGILTGIALPFSPCTVVLNWQGPRRVLFALPLYFSKAGSSKNSQHLLWLGPQQDRVLAVSVAGASLCGREKKESVPCTWMIPASSSAH